MLLTGFALSGLVALVAWRAGSLSQSGAWAAWLTGGLVFGLGGWAWAGLLLAFFITSSGLSYLFFGRKQDVGEKYAKGHRRDWGQVLGNGSVAAVMAVAHALWPMAAWPWLAFAASLAAVNADTWATELGVLSPRPPRLLTDLRRVVEPGASGGVSLAGTLAALAGSALVGGLAARWAPVEGLSSPGTVAIITLAGWLGAFFDSWLGATVQAMYFCSHCQKETEQSPFHRCGQPVEHVRGWRWLHNDWVNLACAGLAALVAPILAFML